jgi:ASCH domain
MSTGGHALSVKQPWAALLVGGVKTVEVRTWTTPRRGPFLIHAAKVPDPRPQAWDALPDRLRELAGRAGGVVGAADLLDVIAYTSPGQFAADAGRHRVPADWYRGPVYGFVVANARPLPFRPWPGNTSFFPFPPPPPPANVIWCDPPEGPG